MEKFFEWLAGLIWIGTLLGAAWLIAWSMNLVG